MTPELRMLFFMLLLKSPHLAQIDSKIHLRPPWVKMLLHLTSSAHICMQSVCSCSSSCVHRFPFSWLTAHLSRLHVWALIQTVQALSVVPPRPPTPPCTPHPSPQASGSYWCRSAPTADRFGVVFIDLHVGWICRWGGLTRCDLGRVPRRRTAATSGWAGRAAMQQSRWAALRALTPRAQTHRRKLTDTPLRHADRCVRHAGTPLNSKI